MIKDEGPWYAMVETSVIPAREEAYVISHDTGARMTISGGDFANIGQALEYAMEVALRLNQQATQWAALAHIKELCDSKVKMTPERARTMLIRDVVRKAMAAVLCEQPVSALDQRYEPGPDEGSSP